MNIKTSFDRIEFDKEINPSEGIGNEAFLLVSQMTPIVNIDLLIRDSNNRVLVAWRDDLICGSGWHLPGGVVRFKETLEERIHKTALLELGTDVEIIGNVKEINEIILEQEQRGHFLSFLYECRLTKELKEPAKKKIYNNGDLHWYEFGTDLPLVKGQIDIYSKYLGGNEFEEN